MPRKQDLPLEELKPDVPAEAETAPEPELVTLPESEPLAEPESSPEPEPVAEPEVYETSAAILREAGSDKPVKEPAGSFLDLVKMSGSLLIICAVVSLVVSFVHAITADTIAEAAAAEQRAAIVSIFGEGKSISELDPLEGTNAVFAIADGEQGYCVSIDAKGFGGSIGMMVGIGADGALCGVEIVSHSETPGFGAKADDPGYLSQYIGHGSDLTMGKEISAISGATISSKAVLAGVNDAVAALVDAGLVPEYHKPEPEPEPTEEELLEAELAALLEELENGGDEE